MNRFSSYGLKRDPLDEYQMPQEASVQAPYEVGFQPQAMQAPQKAAPSEPSTMENIGKFASYLNPTLGAVSTGLDIVGGIAGAYGDYMDANEAERKQNLLDEERKLRERQEREIRAENRSYGRGMDASRLASNLIDKNRRIGASYGG